MHERLEKQKTFWTLTLEDCWKWMTGLKSILKIPFVIMIILFLLLIGFVSVILFPVAVIKGVHSYVYLDGFWQGFYRFYRNNLP